MASAIQHYREAEQLLSYADEVESGSDAERNLLAAAQVHATLALAGATALQAYSDGSEDELEAWARAAGDPAGDD